MKIEIKQNSVVCRREKDDPKFYSTGWSVDGESGFLYYLKNALNKNKAFWIMDQSGPWKKIRMWKHGHLVDDRQQYLFAKTHEKGQRIALWNDHWAVSGLNNDWNDEGVCRLAIER